MRLCFLLCKPFEGTFKKASGEKLNKCNQCEYASSQADSLRSHLKTHSGEKSNKCNQCDFASSRPDHLRQHLKMHSGEKSNECNQCDFSCSDRNSLRRQCSREKSHYYYLLLICPRNRIKAYYVLRGLRSEDQGLRIEK